MHKKGHKGSKAFPKAGKLGKNTIPVGAFLDTHSSRQKELVQDFE